LHIFGPQYLGRVTCGLAQRLVKDGNYISSLAQPKQMISRCSNGQNLKGLFIF